VTAVAKRSLRILLPLAALGCAGLLTRRVVARRAALPAAAAGEGALAAEADGEAGADGEAQDSTQ
jgi:hypothetical protein